jgi:hypothetical protein
MAYAPSWRVVMNEDVMAKLDVLIGMVGELQADQRSLKNSTNSLKEHMNDLRERGSPAWKDGLMSNPASWSL